MLWGPGHGCESFISCGKCTNTTKHGGDTCTKSDSGDVHQQWGAGDEALTCAGWEVKRARSLSY